MRIPISRIFPTLLLATASSSLIAGDSMQAIPSISRCTDRYAKQGGEWRIQRLELTIEFGNAEPGKQLGFGGR